MRGLRDIIFDCSDPWTLAHWWAEVLGYRVHPYRDEDLEQLRAQGIDRIEDDPYVRVEPVEGKGPCFWFCKVPEPKVVKNRVHIDVYGDVDELLGRGATLLERLPKWTIMADPEGNEFCVFEDDPNS